MNRAIESLRWLMALAGLGFWLTGLWMLSQGGDARWAWRCPYPTLTNCFSDYLPVLEAFIPILTLLLAYPIARFVFSMWAPPPEERGLHWWPASRRGSGELMWPVGHLLGATGIFTSLWALLVFPPALQFWPYFLYWGCSALWCTLTVWIAWPPRQEAAA